MFAADPFENIRRIVTAPVTSMRTFQIDQPLDTHFRLATCQEVDCVNYTHGWKMGFDLTDEDKAASARWIRDKSGRSFTFEVTDHSVIFTFAAGQRCFKRHRVPLQREPFYVVRRGDFRGNPDGTVQRHRSADTFIDQWANDLDQLNTVRERG